MAGRTEIVCLCEGKPGRSIDAVFINRLVKALNPRWLRASGSNRLRIVSCGGRRSVIEKLPGELRICVARGGTTTLMVWADCDHDCANGEQLKTQFWQHAQQNGVTSADFERVVFIFPKDRLENWLEFLTTGTTDENTEGPRVRHPGRDVAAAAKELAKKCKAGGPMVNAPPSLTWSCDNWRTLVQRLQ